ncbi:unnamed protein product, partial [Cladocopium goreaui]
EYCDFAQVTPTVGLIRREALTRVFLAWKLGQSQVLQQIDSATPASRIQQLLKPFKGPSNKLRQGLAPLPMIKDARGDFCRTAEDALQRWIAFFGDMEGGQRASQQDQWQRWRANLETFIQHDVVIPTEEVPTLCDLEQACRTAAAGKATGIDAIPSEICKFCPQAVALHLYSLMLKTCVHGQEALSHKGGILLPIWKGKHVKDQCSAFRSILLSSCLGKVMHKAVHTKQLDLYQQFLHNQQLGGRRGVPVTLGGHQVRAFQRHCAQLGTPSALLFIDLQEAFYRVLRPLVVDGPIDDASIAAMAARIGLDVGFLHDLHLALQQPSALQEAGIPRHLQRAIRALHTDTFFKLPTQLDQVVTQLGTRPGDSFADVIFGYLMAKVLQKFQHAMEAQGLLLQVPAVETLSFEGVQDREFLVATTHLRFLSSLADGQFVESVVEHRALYEAIILGILDTDTVSYEAFVRRIIQEQPISWTRCRQTLQEAQRQLQAGFLDVDTVHLHTCLDILRRLATTDAWPFLDQLQSRSPPTVPSMDEIDLQVAETQILPNRQAVPRMANGLPLV